MTFSEMTQAEIDMCPLVSIVVATYRRDTTLVRALASLAAQTYENYEIILVDDNSHPEWNRKVAEIVAEFHAAHPKSQLQYIANEPNQGSAQTRNIGIHAAAGKYVTFLDDDDIYLPDKIKYQVACMEKAGADYSLTDLALYYDDESFCELRTRSFIRSTDYDSMLRYHMLHHLTGTDTMMFRREYLLKIGCFDRIDVGDEFYLMAKAIEARGVFIYLGRSDLKAYVHRGEGGLSSGDGKINGENQLYEFKKQFFSRFSKEDVRFIKTRHYAVLAFAEMRRKSILGFAGNAFKAFLISPIDCLKLLKKHK